jgi:hypothetical protein
LRLAQEPRASPGDSITDPVERERQLIAQNQAPDEQRGETARSAGNSGVSSSLREFRLRWSFLSKLAIVLCIGLIASYLLLWGKTVQDNRGPEGYVRVTDFISTLTGALIIREGEGQHLYELETQRAAQNRVRAPLPPAAAILPYNHLPFEALAVAPLMDLPYPIIFGLWTLLAGLAIGLSLGSLDGALPVSRPVGWVMSLAACSYLPLIRALILGQNSPLVLLGLCATYAALKRGQQGLGGVTLLLVALKPQVLPVVLLLLLLLRQWRALLIFIALILGLSVAAMLVLGPQWPLQYAQLLLGVAGWSDTAAINPAIMHNWRGFVENLLGATAPNLVTPLFVLLSVVSIGLIVWSALRAGSADRQPLQKSYQPGWDLLWALAGIVAVLTSLHLNPHDLTLLIFPAWIIGAYATSGLWDTRLPSLWLVILWVGYVLAPLTLYVENPAVPVIPSVILMAFSTCLLAWQVAKTEAPASNLLVPSP